MTNASTLRFYPLISAMNGPSLFPTPPQMKVVSSLSLLLASSHAFAPKPSFVRSARPIVSARPYSSTTQLNVVY